MYHSSKKAKGKKHSKSKKQQSAIAMNKDLTKKILNTEGIPTPLGFLITGKDLIKVNSEGIKNFPCVIKPNNEGSSIGVEIIKNSEALLELLNSEKGKANTRNESKTYLVEEYIPGRELTTAIVDSKPLGAVSYTHLTLPTKRIV